MFEKFKFSARQVRIYLNSALRDFKIAAGSDIPEVTFRFCYDCLLKLAITVCAQNGLRAKSHKGHHFELITKFSELLNDNDISVIGNQMRSKRNKDLYSGGAVISKKEAGEYIEWIHGIINTVETYLKPGSGQKELI